MLVVAGLDKEHILRSPGLMSPATYCGSTLVGAGKLRQSRTYDTAAFQRRSHHVWIVIIRCSP